VADPPTPRPATSNVVVGSGSSGEGRWVAPAHGPDWSPFKDAGRSVRFRPRRSIPVRGGGASAVATLRPLRASCRDQSPGQFVPTIACSSLSTLRTWPPADRPARPRSGGPFKLRPGPGTLNRVSPAIAGGRWPHVRALPIMASHPGPSARRRGFAAFDRQICAHLIQLPCETCFRHAARTASRSSFSVRPHPPIHSSSRPYSAPSG
jgi:hypothetical protein